MRIPAYENGEWSGASSLRVYGSDFAGGFGSIDRDKDLFQFVYPTYDNEIRYVFNGGKSTLNRAIKSKDISVMKDAGLDRELRAIKDAFANAGVDVRNVKVTLRSPAGELTTTLTESIKEGAGRSGNTTDRKYNDLISDIYDTMQTLDKQLENVFINYYPQYRVDLEPLMSEFPHKFDISRYKALASVYNENEPIEYKLAFKPVNDVVDVDCIHGLISAVRSAGFKYHSARKLAGDYYITIICEPKDLSRAKLAIENCGFFKSWLNSSESIKPKFSKLALVKESGVYKFTKQAK